MTHHNPLVLQAPVRPTQPRLSVANPVAIAVAAAALALAGCAQRPTGLANPAPPPVASPDARAIDAEVARIMAGSHAAMPSLQQVQRSPSSQVAEINTRNNTPYTLVIRYSGPTSQRLMLKPQNDGQVRLSPGNYAVAVTVEGATTVQPFAGRQEIASGTYKSTWYIETTRR